MQAEYHSGDANTRQLSERDDGGLYEDHDNKTCFVSSASRTAMAPRIDTNLEKV